MNPSKGRKADGERGVAARRELIAVLTTVIAAAMSAFGLHYFVFSASFAPSGIDGVATMLRELTGVNAGVYSILFNLPLLLVAWFFLKRRYVIYTLAFTLLSSLLLILLEAVNFPIYEGVADGLVAAAFSGVILGVRTGIMLRIGASTGGVDIAAGMVTMRWPHLNVERIIALICYGIILLSYFVYHDVTSILLSFIQMFIFDRFAGAMLRDSRNAVEVTIVTKHPESIRNEIIYTLKHGATAVSSRGMYTDGESSMIVSVINLRQIPAFLEIIRRHPDTFAYYGELMGVYGNFRWRKDDAVK